MSPLKRSALVAALAGGLTLALAAPASAHVTVNPNTATPGSYSKVTFRVPTESDTLSTTKVEVNLPTDRPVASVSVKPVPGWTAATEKTKLTTPITSDDGQITEAVTKITWTADSSSAIKPGQFQEFDVSLGPLPDSGQLIFKALQTYSDGSIVRWIDEPSTDGSEPEHPAPVLKLAAAAAPAAAAGSTPEPASDGPGALGVAGLIAGLLALVLALLAYQRAARRPTPATAATPSEERVPATKA